MGDEQTVVDPEIPDRARRDRRVVAIAVAVLVVAFSTVALVVATTSGPEGVDLDTVFSAFEQAGATCVGYSETPSTAHEYHDASDDLAIGIRGAVDALDHLPDDERMVAIWSCNSSRIVADESGDRAYVVALSSYHTAFRDDIEATGVGVFVSGDLRWP